MITIALLIPLLLVSWTKDSVMVAMRDGTRLNTNIYKPSDTTGFPLPVVLVRTPYGADGGMLPGAITRWTDTRNYILAFQDTRGRHESEGVDSVFLDDGWRYDKRDGYDAVEWLVDQPWCDGNIGTLGGSANGITQNLLAGAAHPNHVCANPVSAAFDMYRHAAMPGGEFRQHDMEYWLNLQQATYMIDYYADHYSKDSTWSYLDVRTRRDSMHTAMLSYGGWYDIFSQGTVEGYQALSHLGNQRLLMGPWGHLPNWPWIGEIAYPRGFFDGFQLYADQWYDFWLKDSGSISHMAQVNYYLMGPVDTVGYWNNWYTADDWPPSPDTVVIYLRRDSSLAFLPPPAAEPPDTFVYDPRDPVPSNGGNNLNLPPGPRNQQAQWFRDDVVRYTTGPLEQDVVIKGRIWVRLYASSDRTDTDFTAKLVDVYPDGRKMLVIDGILMARHHLGLEREDLLTPGEVYEFNIDLSNTAYTFPVGHEIGLAISSSNSPRFMVNLNTGGHPLRDTVDTLVATNVVHHTSDYRSRMVFEGVGPAGIAGDPVPGRPDRARIVPDGVYDASGRRVSTRVDAAVLVRLRPGCYFLREGGSTRKVVRVR